MYLLAGLRAVDGLAVVDGVVDRDVPLEGDADGHVDGGGDGDGEAGVEEVGKEVDVDIGGLEPEAPAKRLQDAADQDAGVHADQGDQQKVERVAHVVPVKQYR